MPTLLFTYIEPWNGDFELKPVLMKSSMESIKDIEPADHIMDDSDHHWLVESVNITASSFTGFTCKGQRVSITKVLWKDDLFKIQYPQCNMETSTILQKARTELENKVKWKESVRFVTNVKWGKSFAINKASLLDSNCAPVSCIRVTPHIVLDRGDHMMVKTDSGYCSVLIEAILDANTVVCMPDLDGVETRNAVVISKKGKLIVSTTNNTCHQTRSWLGLKALRDNVCYKAVNMTQAVLYHGLSQADHCL